MTRFAKRQLLMTILLYLLAGCTAKAGPAEDALLVQEAVIRYQFAHHHAVGRDEVSSFCVEFANESARADPPVVLIQRLNNSRRKVIAGSSCDRNRERGVVEKVSGKPALVLVVGNVEWNSDVSAVVEGGYYQAAENVAENVYYLKKLDGMWSVTHTLSSSSADSPRDEGDQAFKAGKYAKAYAKWFPRAEMGDSEKQELIANLLLGPHAHAVKHDPYLGTRFLYRAAIAGRRTAMLRLSDAINKGSSGLKRVPAAAKCWSKAPASIEERGVCVGLTDFDVPRARASCSELPYVKEQDGTNKEEGVGKAKLCLANKTPTLLVPGPPPGAEDIQRAREYARHGIEWQITGDVYEEDFERYRENFNATTIAGIEAKHGRGYLEKLSKEIDARIMKSKR